ncbi:hypothetical protein HGRIS_012235 [Hohenbuehelia grisea]|uniref:Uncharacterized protein n=1 Tax=Hohenbuehelia grisea TaxID=104357 RepID=A0ABR3IRQ1_9AGAR
MALPQGHRVEHMKVPHLPPSAGARALGIPIKWPTVERSLQSASIWGYLHFGYMRLVFLPPLALLLLLVPLLALSFLHLLPLSCLSLSARPPSPSSPRPSAADARLLLFLREALLLRILALQPDQQTIGGTIE